jgi:D-lactate dehydrogenase
MAVLSEQFQNALQRLLSADQILRDPGERWSYGYDNSRCQDMPDVVVFPTSHAEVRDIVLLCNESKVPVITRGRGTGTTGAVVPVAGGLVLATEKMHRIQTVDTQNRFVQVEPGVTNQAVQDAAAAHGFFWPPDPTSAAFSSVGGNLAYNSSGPRAVKYGTPRENVLGLRAVTGDGREIRTGVFTSKGVVGYDLTRLLIGSEGTLAVITEATLRLLPVPDCKRTLQLTYRDIESATRAVSDIMAQPVIPCALEFMDARAIEMIRRHTERELPEHAGALLIIEVDGETHGIDHAVNAVLAAARNDGLSECLDAKDADEAARIWATRKALSPALRTVAPKKINEDVVVPVANIPRLIRGLELLADEYEIIIVNFGHAGNGNIHVNLLLDPDDPVQARNAEACLDKVFTLVLKLNGTLSGEHGVGLVKRDFIAREIDPVTLGLMRQIKSQFDPNGILNPGKTLPALDGA